MNRTLCVFYTFFFLAFFVIPVLSYAKTEEIVAAFLFDEGSGEAVKDATGNGHDGKLIKAKWAEGKYNKALEFDGSSAYVEAPYADELALEKYTVGAWINCPGAHTWQTVIARDYLNNVENRNYGIFVVDGNTNIHFSFKNAAGQHFGPNGTKIAADGKWHHVAMSYDGKVLRGYVDGEKDIEQSLQGPPTTTQHKAPVMIGGEPGRYYLKGRVDEPFISNKVMEASEIKNLMEGLKGFLAVSQSGKLTQTWGSIKAH